MQVKFLVSLFIFFVTSSQASVARSTVWVAEIRGTINPASSDFLKESIQKATKDRAELLLVELDTPGGLVTSVREMTQAIDNSTVPVVVYVTPAGAAATSAGALLMIGSHYGVMAPGSNIGAAHPVGAQGKEVKGVAGEKAVNDVSAMARSLAKLRGRNVDLAEKVVSKSKSFTAEEALKNNLIDALASTRSELLVKLHLQEIQTKYGKKRIKTQGALIKISKMTLGQMILHVLAHPNIAAILMTLGMILIYFEISNPGLTIAGIAGTLCLLIAFTAFQVLPMQTAGVVLLVLGLSLMVAELLVSTGGVLAGGGVISFVLGLLWFVDPAETDLRVSDAVLLGSSLGLGITALIVAWSTGRIKRLTRELKEKLGGGAQIAGLKGYQGEILSVRPGGKSGKATIRGEVWDVFSSDSLKKGDSIEITEMSGFRIKVKK